MAKKKKKPRKWKPPKPLMSLTGILHLQSSFVQPTQESGLLNTVGGGLEPQALVLAPNYGYGISASFVSQLENRGGEEDPTPQANVIEVNGVPTITTDKNVIELNEDFPMKDKTKKDGVPDNLSIAELVRSIGGAKDKPFMRSDVVEDAAPEVDDSNMDQSVQAESQENDPEEDKFYESLGLSRPAKEQAVENDGSRRVGGGEMSVVSGDKHLPAKDETASVAEYYKTYCQYYYSVDPEPLGEKPIEFGRTISNEVTPEQGKESQTSVIELAKMAQRARRAMDAATRAAKKVYGPITQPEESNSYDPLPMEIIPSETPETLVRTKDTTMDQYWEYVKENPRDFNRWTYLIQHAENAKNLAECRKAYSAFLPLFPYCFGYWKRYCEIEKSHAYYQRALSILMRGLEFNPLCIDLWQSYLKLFKEVYCHQENFQVIMREQYERALNSAGLEFRSDALWDDYIGWETNSNCLKKVFAIYRRLLYTPTRLYNRHWDNLNELVRDHHPRDFLEKEEYELLRKKGCKALKFRYREEPDYEPGEIIKTSKPEDRLMDTVKEKVLSQLKKRKKINETETDKRWLYEDKIKRPYFHIKPLDKGQLRNWESYLNFEIAQGNHDRTVLLFERCLIACALYERFWVKYARFLEKYHRQESHAAEGVSKHFQKSQISFDIGTRKELLEEEALVSTVTLVLKEMIDKVITDEEEEKNDILDVMESVLSVVCESSTNVCSSAIDILLSNVHRRSVNVSTEKAASVALSGDSNITELPPNSVEQNTYENDVSSLTSQLSVPVFVPGKLFWHDIIRDVYKRASVVHCPRKPSIRLQWAAFEEEIGNIVGARQLIQHCLDWFPTLLDAKSQMIELERRSGNHEQVVKLFEAYLNKPTDKVEFSTLSMKYARFLYKEQGKPDKALAVLRKAVKKDRGNHLLYSCVFEICHERFPTDRKGAAAALELAIQTKDIKNEYKLQFLKKKVLFLQEHGELAKYRDALDQLYELQELLAVEEAAQAAIAAKDNTSTAIPPPQQSQTFPVPVWSTQETVPINFERVEEPPAEWSAENLNENQNYGGQEPNEAYRSVPPITMELARSLPSSYGYHSKHPDFRLQEHLSHREYDSLVARGYPDQLRDKDKVPNNPSRANKKRKSNAPIFIVPPKGRFLSDYLARARGTNKRE